MHFITMHNSILPKFSVVLIGIILLFSKLGVLPQTLEPRRIELPLLPQASSFLHVCWNIFIKVFIKVIYFIICIKKKNLFSNDVKCYLYFVGWQWNHGMMLWWRFYCTGKYIPRINNPWPSDPCAVLKHQPTDSLWMG